MHLLACSRYSADEPEIFTGRECVFGDFLSRILNIIFWKILEEIAQQRACLGSTHPDEFYCNFWMGGS